MFMSPLFKGVIALACVMGGAVLGMLVRSRLPEAYQGAESKDVVRLVMGLVLTTAALALGLLVGSAKSFYDTQNAGMAQIAADYIMLDRILDYYGPESAGARSALRDLLANQVEGTGLEASSKTYAEIKSGAQVGDALFHEIQKLSPKDDVQRFYKQECLGLGIQLGQTRWLMYEQNTVPFPTLLLVVLLVWLFLLFISFGIFAPRNPLVMAGFFVSGAALSGAILLILAMYNPQRGLIRVSNAPLRAAMDQIKR